MDFPCFPSLTLTDIFCFVLSLFLIFLLILFFIYCFVVVVFFVCVCVFNWLVNAEKFDLVPMSAL